MAKYAVHIIHSGKQKLDYVIDTNYKVSQVKEQLYQLTGIPVPRQKIICATLWKGFLNDSTDLSTIKFQDGIQINLMGTAESIPTSDRKIVFVEDLPPSEAVKVTKVPPAGLLNLGNTCYCNALLQKLALSFGTLLKELSQSTSSVAPSNFLESLRAVYPQFAEQDRGIPRQQDSYELYVSLTETLVNTLNSVNPLYDNLFKIEYDQILKNTETNEEQTLTGEVIRSLTCVIQGGAISSDKIDFIHQGIALSLEGDVDKFSNELNRNSVWHKTQKLSSLPPYLCIQLSRFFWKATPEARNQAGIKCKILRPINFQEKFDIYEFCNDKLKNILKSTRDISDQKSLLGALPSDVPTMALEPQTVGPLIPPTFDGTYQLFGVVSHKGRSADSGHYIGWVKKDDSWYCCDDNDVQECLLDHVLDLKGGSDNDIGYLLFYKMKI